MTCTYCGVATVHIANFGPNQARRCPICAALFKGPRFPLAAAATARA